MQSVMNLGFRLWFIGVAGVLVAASVSVAGCSSSGGSQSGPVATAGTSSMAGTSGTGGEAGATPVETGNLVCSSNADCTGEQRVCDPVQGCVSCLHDWDCPANDRCESNQCFAKTPCKTSDDCSNDADRKVCDAVEQVCVGCREDSECGDGQRCDSGKCVAFEACTNSRACTGGKVCSRDLGACVTCVVDGDCGEGSACVGNSCVPTCASDKECLGLGLLCDLKLGRCVECLAHADCPEKYFCATSERCELDVCDKDQTRCEDAHTLGTCSSVGDRFVNSTCSADSGCQETSRIAASCAPLVCEPGSVKCSTDQTALVTCSADGFSVEKTAPCGNGRVCDAAACTDVVCAPNTTLCDSNTVYECNALGTGKTLVKACVTATNETCNADTGTCDKPECVAQAAVCAGNVATICGANNKPQPGGTDCATSSQGCYNGKCADIVCTGSHQCTGGVLYQCANNGTTETQVKDCGSPGLCDAASGKCLTPQCTPNAFVCNGNVATRCKSDGSGYDSAVATDCAASSKVCDGGGCLPKVCPASTYFCEGGSPQHCSATGATYAPSDSCFSDEYCSDGATYCLFDKCTAGSAVCNGNLATTCASDGSGPVTGGTDCAASNTACDSGACKPVVCTPGSFICQGEAVYHCNATGTGSALSQSCSTATFCDASSGSAVCSPDICTASALGCDGEVISTCGSNGGSWTNPGTNCASSSQVCALGGTCAAQEVAVQGGSTYSTSGFNDLWLMGFRVLEARKLTQIEVNASTQGVQRFTWVVYAQRPNSTIFDLVYQAVTAQKQTALAFASSGALSYVFEKGKTYAVGVHIQSSAAVAYYSNAAQASFFTAATSYLGFTNDTPAISIALSPTSTRANLRLTTVLAP